MADRTGTPQAPLAHGDDKEHRRQIAQRANQALPKSGSEPMLGNLDMGGFTVVNDGGSPWIAPAYSAANFTGSGSMTWTVEEADVVTYKYIISGKTMIVSVSITSSTVGGTLDDALIVAIPASKVSTNNTQTTGVVFDNGAEEVCRIFVTPSSTVIGINKIPTGNYSASTNNTIVVFTITFEIN
jgi:hypothetical protein